MAVTVTKNLTDLWNAETEGTWELAIFDPSLYSGFNREGTYCCGIGVSNTTLTDYQAFTAFSMVGKAVYIWIFCAGNMDTLANGGIGIVLGDVTNTRAYHVAGSDLSKFQIGTWACYMVEASNPPTQYTQVEGSAAPDFSAITKVGLRFKTLSKALGGADNCFWDIARYGTGLTIKGGTSEDPGTFTEIAADDESKASGKAYGIIREVQTGVFEVQGSLIFGDDGAESTYFKDQDAIVVFADNGAGGNFYQVKVVGNSTGINSFVLGNKVGSGDTAVGSNGCTIMSAGPGLKVDLSTSPANVNTLNIYGSKFYKVSNGFLGSTNTAHEFIGNIIDQCGQADPKQMVVRNCIFSGYTLDADGAILWNESINIKNCNFNANTDVTNDPAGIEHPDSEGSPYTYDNLKVSGNDYDINNTSGSAITINRENGSNADTYKGSSVTFVESVTLTVQGVKTGEEPTNHVRCRIETDPGGAELMNKEATISYNGYYKATEQYNYTGDQSVIIKARYKGYLPFRALGTITSTGLTVTVVWIEDPNFT